MSAITKYLSHLPTCNIKQDWTEAIAAFSDTPSRFRDQDWNEARQELDIKMQTCTCGLIDSISELDQQSTSLRQEVERLRGEKAEVIKGFIEWYNSLHSSNYVSPSIIGHYLPSTHHGKGGTEG